MGSSTVRNKLIAEREKEEGRFKDDGTLNRDAIGPKRIPGKDTRSRSYERDVAQAESDERGAMRKGKKAERQNQRYDQMLENRKQAAARAAETPQYVNKVQERKKKQKAKLKAAQKRGLILGED